MALTRERKAEILDELKGLLEESKSVIFVKNSGLNVDEVNELRANLRKEDARMKIAKKTLLKIALKELNMPEVSEEILEGPIGITFSMGDQVSAAKVLGNFAKDNDHIELVGAILDDQVLDKGQTVALSKLPGREELLAMFVRSAKAPISGFHGVTRGVLSGFAQVLDQIRQQKEQAGA